MYRATTIDAIDLMSDTTTTKKTEGEYKTNYTDRNGVKLRESYIPHGRPSYTKWVKSMGINEVTYQHHPDAKGRADQITEPLGVPRRPTLAEHLIGADVWRSEDFK